jgi:UDP-2,4-diacetamido-2,4,6-trideoxy-beta-L-altropyranose hydrolase
MKIVIRVDAHNEVALGHLNRCIALSSGLIELENRVEFVVYNDESAIGLLDGSGLSFQTTQHKINESGIFQYDKSIISKINPDILIIDSYYVDDQYINHMKEVAPFIVYLDDEGKNYNVDMVINPSCRANFLDYQSKIRLLGNQYTILSHIYWDQDPCYGLKKITSIMVTMGGVDHYNLSSLILKYLNKIDNRLKVNMIIGPYYDNRNEIMDSISKSNLNVEVFEGLTNIYPVICMSDIAISAGGVSVYELAATSTPMIGISLWENQKNNIKCLSSSKALLPLYYSSKIKFNNELFLSMKEIISNSTLRNSMAESGRRYVDGQGVRRISLEINKLK